MKKVYNVLSKVCSVMDKAILGISAVSLGILTLLIFVQVVMRYLFSNSLSWSEEIARYLEVYIVFLCGAYAIGHGQHIAMDIVITRIPKKAATIVNKFTEVLFIAFSIFFLIYSVSFMISEKAQIMASIRWLPKNCAYFALPLSAVAMLIYSLKLLFTPGTEANDDTAVETEEML